jgi:hypothetical protein
MTSRGSEPSGVEPGVLRATADVVVRVEPRSDGDDAELVELTQRLRAQHRSEDDSLCPPAQREYTPGLRRVP